MNTLEIFLFAVMVSATPPMLLLAVALWRPVRVDDEVSEQQGRGQ